MVERADRELADGRTECRIRIDTTRFRFSGEKGICEKLLDALQDATGVALPPRVSGPTILKGQLDFDGNEA